MSCSNVTVIYNCTRNEELAKWQTVCFSMTFVMCVVGNAIIIGVLLFCHKTRLNRLEIFLLHIALADIFVAFLNTFTQLLWHLCFTFLFSSEFTCRAMKFLQMAPVYASTYILVICSIDRYLAIAFPLVSRRLFPGKQIHRMAAMGWLLGLLVAAPQLFIFTYSEEHEACEEKLSDLQLFVYVNILLSLIFFIPLFILIACNSAMCVVLCRGVNFLQSSSSTKSDNGRDEPPTPPRQNSIASLLTGSRSRRRRSGEKKASVPTTSKKTELSRRRSASLIKSVRMTLVVCILYVICWTPFFASQVYWVFNPELDECTVGIVVNIAIQLGSLNSCCNPWVYGFFALPKLFNRRHRKKSITRGTFNQSMSIRTSAYSRTTTTSYLTSDAANKSCETHAMCTTTTTHAS